MTAKEKLMKDDPNKVNGCFKGGAQGCPTTYGYLPFPEMRPDGVCRMTCDECWNRQVPGTDANPTPVIKDSGERRQFDTGAVRDIQEGKGRMDLLPWAAVMEVSKHCEAGAVKYGEHNVDKGIPTHSLCDSAARHLAKYLDGWRDEQHLLAAAWNLLWAIQMEIKHPECVDTPWEVQRLGVDLGHGSQA